jgi:hypothetical protein
LNNFTPRLNFVLAIKATIILIFRSKEVNGGRGDLAHV